MTTLIDIAIIIAGLPELDRDIAGAILPMGLVMPEGSVVPYSRARGPLHAIGIDLTDEQLLATAQKISDAHAARTPAEKLATAQKCFTYSIVAVATGEVLLEGLNGNAICDIFELAAVNKKNFLCARTYDFQDCKIVNTADRTRAPRSDKGHTKPDSMKTSYNVMACDNHGAETGEIFHSDQPGRAMQLLVGKTPTKSFQFSKELALKKARYHQELGYFKITLGREGSDGRKRVKF